MKESAHQKQSDKCTGPGFRRSLSDEIENELLLKRHVP